MVLLKRLLRQRGERLLSQLDTLRCRRGGGAFQELVLELGGELAQAAGLPEVASGAWAGDPMGASGRRAITG
ncbi:hypothetical protein ABT033_28070 [Streptomyces pharetrae]|uniref:hypothetical protein n=1 Tax=Streptomyces pharetrae TaxID=291370 RepID=UPI0033507ACA